VLVAASVTLACGVAPAIYAIRSSYVPAFHGSRASGSRGACLTRRILIVTQIAIAIVLLCGAGLIARTLIGLMSDRAGADPDRALVAKLMLSDTRFDVASHMPALREMLRRVRTLPGVEHAAIGTNIPPRVTHISFSVEVTTDGRAVNHRVYLASVTSGFFEAMGIPVLEGRGIDDTDEERDGPVIVLSQSAARLLSPSRSLVGGLLPWPLPAGAGGGRRPLVAGVVGNVKYGGLDAPALAAIYTRWIDLPSSSGHLVVRASGDPMVLASTIRKTLSTVDPFLASGEIRTVRQEYASSIADRRIRLLPAAGFGVLAIAVALVGLGARLARAVAERRRELAIRIVLGSSPGGAIGVIMREGVLLAAIGVTLGLAASAGAARWLESLLYGVRPLDFFTFTAVAGFVIAAALLTSFLAARRAAHVEPLELLRAETSR
jgi:predicted permease